MFPALSLLWTAIWWLFAWSHLPIVSEYSFFPLWLGYVFSINAICRVWFRDSLLVRMGWSFVWLFILSVPLWWFFEYLNTIVQNWHYSYRPISELHYAVQSSLDFSTVIPAVLSAGFLFEKMIGARFDTNRGRSVRSAPIVLFLFGVVSFILMLVRPDLLFPFVWLAPLFVLDPVNYWLGYPSVIAKLGRGERSPVFAVACGTLFTGFWWEMWNFWSYPKWFYTIPYVGFWKVFEMPILGYSGYLFFGLIIWSYTVFTFSLLRQSRPIKAIAVACGPGARDRGCKDEAAGFR